MNFFCRILRSGTAVSQTLIFSMFLTCATAFSQAPMWTGAGANDDFFNSQNWNPGIPTPMEFAIFSLNQAYNVDLTNNAEVEAIRVSDGQMMLLGGNEITALSGGNASVIESGELQVYGPGTVLRANESLLVGTDGPASLSTKNGGLAETDFVAVFNDSSITVNAGEFCCNLIQVGQFSNDMAALRIENGRGRRICFVV